MKGKKDFTGGLSSLLGDTPEPIDAPQEQVEKPGPGRPKTSTREINKTSQIGTKEEETRATFIVNEAVLEKIKAIAYWDRLPIKDVVAGALEDFIRAYEKINGPVQAVPTRK